MNKESNSVGIIEKIYLKDGCRHWTGTMEEALFVIENSFRFESIDELFQVFDESSDLLITFKDWGFDEIVCSAVSFIYSNNNKITFIWSPICAFLLFTKSLDFSNTLLLFLQKNVNVNEFLAKKSALSCFTGFPIRGVRVGHLINLLNFLEIEKEDQKEIISNCSKINNYEPLMFFLIKSVKR